MESANNQPLRLILNSSLDGIFATDADLRITEWNFQMFRFSGVKREDCVGSTLSRLFPALDDTHLLQKLRKVLRGQSVIIKGMPFNKLLQHGINEFYEGYYSPIMNEAGEIEGMVGVVREIGLRSGLVSQKSNLDQSKDPVLKGPDSAFQQKIRDISEKHNELVRIVNHSPAIAFSCRVDQERTLNYISDNVYQLGYNANELMEKNRSIKSMVNEDDYQELEKDYRNYIIAGEEENFIREFRVNTSLGNKRWIQERSWLRKDDQGNPIAMEGVLMDVSVKKFAEDALLSSKEHFRLMFEKAPIGMAIINRDGSFSKVNDAFRNLTGYDENEMYEIKIHALYPSEDAVATRKHDEQLFSDTNQGYTIEKKLIRNDQTTIYILEQGAPLHLPAGDHQKLIQVVDITSRIIAEKELRESEKRLVHAQSFAKLGSWEYDPHAQSYALSDEIYKIFAIDKDQPIEKELINRFLSADEYNLIRENFQHFIADDSIDEFDQQINVITASKMPRVLQIKGAKVRNSRNQFEKTFGFLHDITELKQTERDLRVRNNELTNFVYKISHDLRSPLSSISGLLMLIQPETDTNKQYLSLIKDRIERLDKFISDILSHSKNLYTSIDISQINLQNLVRECLHELSHLRNFSEIKVNLDIQDEDFYSDRSRVKDIIKNLCSNAIHHINPSNQEHTLSVEAKISTKQLDLKVKDNGLGIDINILPRIYDIFFRGSEYSGGSGLGLYIVRQAVDKLNGKIDVETSTRSGTTFLVSIPNQQNEDN